MNTEPKRLPFIELEDIRGPGDIFACVPYNARLAAGECLRRQARHGTRRAVSLSGAVDMLEGRKPGTTRLIDSGRCGNCAFGRRVSELAGSEQ